MQERWKQNTVSRGSSRQIAEARYFDEVTQSRRISFFFVCLDSRSTFEEIKLRPRRQESCKMTTYSKNEDALLFITLKDARRLQKKAEYLDVVAI